jgi:hypothetical protein
MKKLFLLSVILVTAISCSSVKVSSDYDKTVDFSKYKTYAFTNETLNMPLNDLDRKRVLNGVAAELAGKGFTQSETNPDVLIDINVKTETNQTATASTTGVGGYGGYGYGYRYGGYGYGGGFTTTTINYDTYTDGTLFIDMIDAAKKQLVWQGRGTKTLEEDASAQRRQDNLDYALKQIFTQYPPKP